MKYVVYVVIVFIVFIILFLQCGNDDEMNYAIIEGSAHVLLEYGGIAEEGIQLNIPEQEISIKSVDEINTEYRGLLMPKIVYKSRSGSKEVSDPLTVIRSGKIYRYYGFHRTLAEVHQRYKEAGGTGIYYPESYFKDTKFFDIYKIEELR